MMLHYIVSRRNVTVYYSATVGVAVFVMSFSVLTKEGEERIQALNTWRPYDLKLNRNFWLTWIYELIGHCTTSSVHMSVESLVPGIIIQLCCQLEFLKHRINNFPHRVRNMQNSLNSNVQKFESNFISKSVTHHNSIYQ